MKNKKTLYILISIGIALAVIILLFWLLSGDKIGPGKIRPEKDTVRPQAETAEVVVKTMTEWYDAVGTVVPKTQASIEPQVSAQVVEVMVNAGASVEKGDLLVRLEDDRLQSKLSQAQQQLQSAITQREQARQAVNSAEAAFAQARSAYKRIKNFYEAEAATEQELEQVRSRFLQAEAALQRARDGLDGAKSGIRLAEEMVQEAKISFQYTDIVAPSDGKVLKRLVDPGDMAMPGKPVLLMRTAGGLQLEANVRESLITKIRPGDKRNVRLTTIDKTVEAVISEIVPFIDPQTRTFLVKAELPEMEDVYPGMYGKLMIPFMEAPVILIPGEAVRQVGQLQLVKVRTEDGWQRRYIKTGNIYGEKVEVLSGLSGDETVFLEEPGKNVE